MIIRKKMSNDKRSASAWICYDGGIDFGITDYDPCLGYIDSDDDGDATIFIYKERCKDANVKIKFI